MGGEVTVVIMTHDRCAQLEVTLDRLLALPDRPRIVVADNGSHDGTAEAVRRQFPAVGLLRLRRNAGVRARNLAVRDIDTPVVAFNDDDSWWEPGSLTHAADLFDRHPRLGTLCAHIRVGADASDDPISRMMAASPLASDDDLPGTPVLGFLACAAVVRRNAFLEVGGFEERFHFAGEEQLLATDLTARGWAVRYLPELAVRHDVSTARPDPNWRRRRELRNDLWFLWLRRPAGTALRRSRELLRDAPTAVAWPALGQALRGVPWVGRQRRVVPRWLEHQLTCLDPAGAGEARGRRDQKP